LGTTAGKNWECRVTKQKLTQFSNASSFMSVPCKYAATTMLCAGYKIHVGPNMMYDKRGSLYTGRVFFSIVKQEGNQTHFWRGLVGNRGLMSHFANASSTTALVTKAESANLPFEVREKYNAKRKSVRVGVSGSGFSMTFSAYDIKNKRLRVSNGVIITCPENEVEFKEFSEYPNSVCGNSTEQEVREMKNDLKEEYNHKKFTDGQTLVYNLMDQAKEFQSDDRCSDTFLTFEACKTEDKLQAIASCSNLFDRKVTTALFRHDEVNSRLHPLTLFDSCMTMRCTNNKKFDRRWACSQLEDVPKSVPKRNKWMGDFKCSSI